MSGVIHEQGAPVRRAGLRTRTGWALGAAAIACVLPCAPAAGLPAEVASADQPVAVVRNAVAPDSLAVVGHSGATGESTVPYENGDTKTNTWASGTNPAVRSVYQRLLVRNPQIGGHVTNAAQGGASISDIEQQAIEVAEAHPDLLLVQAIDGDLTCPATPADVIAYGRGGCIAS